MKGGLGAVDRPRWRRALERPALRRVHGPRPRLLRAGARGRRSARRAREKGVPFSAVGWVGGDRLRIEARGRQLIDEPLAALTELWRTAFARAIESADVL